MPIYEYGCYDCRKKVSIFFRTMSAAQSGQAVCPRCQGKNIKRLISKVAFVRSEESRMESMADPSSLAGLDENDPQSMARWLRKMGNEMGGEELGPEFDEVVGRLEAGEDPETIEQSMPELGASPAADDWAG